MVKKEIIELLSEHNLKWEDFSEWFIGTIQLNENGEAEYYEWDVKGFIRERVEGIKNPWD